MPCIFDILSLSCKSKSEDSKNSKKIQKRISKKNFFREMFTKSEYSTNSDEVKTDDLNPKMPLDELKMVIANKKISLHSYKNIREKKEVGVYADKILQNANINSNDSPIQSESHKLAIYKTETMSNESSKNIFSHKLLLNLFRKRKRLYQEPTSQNNAFIRNNKQCDSPIINSTSKLPTIDVIINKKLLLKSPNLSTNPQSQTLLSTFKGPKFSNKAPCELEFEKEKPYDNTYEMPLYQESEPNHIYCSNEASYQEEHYDLPWDLTSGPQFQSGLKERPLPTLLSSGVDERPCAEYNEPWSQLLPLIDVTNVKTTAVATKFLAMPQPTTCFKHLSPPPQPSVSESIHFKIKLFESQLNFQPGPASNYTNSLASRRRTCLNVKSDLSGGPLSLSIYPASTISKTPRATPSFKKQPSVMTRSLDQGAMTELL